MKVHTTQTVLGVDSFVNLFGLLEHMYYKSSTAVGMYHVYLMSMTETICCKQMVKQQPARKPTKLTVCAYHCRIPNMRFKHKHSNGLYTIYTKL